MSHRIPSVSDLNVRSEQPRKRFKTSANAIETSTYHNVFEQFDDVPPSPALTTTSENLILKTFLPKSFSQLSSSTSSSTARSIMTKTISKQKDELWSMLFQPKSRGDLIVHPKKVKDLEEILQKSCEIVKTNKVNENRLCLFS